MEWEVGKDLAAARARLCAGGLISGGGDREGRPSQSLVSGGGSGKEKHSLRAGSLGLIIHK